MSKKQKLLLSEAYLAMAAAQLAEARANNRRARALLYLCEAEGKPS